MRWCLRWKFTARQIVRYTMSWRTARAFCAVWFALTSVGLPMSLSSLTSMSCAKNPESQCRCSMSKRLSGTCCCRQAEPQQVAKSCCSAKKPSPKTSEPTVSRNCSSIFSRTELSIARCDCPADSPESVSPVQEPRLPADASAMALPNTTATFAALPTERVESALLLPPVPPPKVVL